MFGSVVFHMPGELQASPAIRGSWQKPILDLLLEAGVLGYANDVESAVAGFIGWCESQDPRPASLGVISLPGLDEFHRLIEQYIRPDEMVYLVVGDAATQRDRLEALGLGQPRTLDVHGSTMP